MSGKRREEQNRTEHKRLDSGALRPEIKIARSSVEALPKKFNEVLTERYGSLQAARTTNLSTPNQEKAFRYAKDLGITLNGPDAGRWIKMFNQASAGRKPSNLESAYSYCKDHPEWDMMDNPARMNLFFKIYENGLNNSYV